MPLVALLGRKAHVSVQRAWGRYNECLVVRPLLTRSVTAMVGLVTGDAVAQMSAGGDFDAGRSVRVGLFALLINGPMCYKFYNFLDKVVYPANPTSWRAVAAKVAIDQMLFSPPLLCLYLSAMKTMEGRPWEAASTIKEKAVPCISAGLAFWVPAHVFNFKLIPDAYRTLAVVSFGVVWSAILSTISTPKTLTIRHLEEIPYKYIDTVHEMEKWSASI